MESPILKIDSFFCRLLASILLPGPAASQQPPVACAAVARQQIEEDEELVVMTPISAMPPAGRPGVVPAR
jgi:hypothetical protein